MSFERLVKDLFNYCRSHDIDDLYFDVRPFWNVYTELRKMPDLEPYWDDEMVLFAVQSVLNSYGGKLPVVDQGICDDLVTSVKDCLTLNSEFHVIVLPIEKAHLEETIQFGDFMFIPDEVERNAKVAQIADFVGIPFHSADSFAKHTESSRSPDFFKHVLLCLKVKHQTNVVRFNSENTMRLSVYILRALYYGYVKNTSNDRGFSTLKFLFKKHGMTEYENTHLAIYAQEDWRFGHSPIHFGSECQFNLDWLSLPVYQEKFLDLHKSFILAKGHDDFSHRFVNSLRFLNKAIERQYHPEPLEHSGLLLLFVMIAAECILLPSGENEKRLRLAALLPRLADIPGESTHGLSEIVNQVYMWRNGYVHSGDDIFIDRYDENTDKFDDLTLKMVAKVIVDYPKHEGVLETKRKNLPEATRINLWTSHLHQVFDGLIFGSVDTTEE